MAWRKSLKKLEGWICRLIDKNPKPGFCRHRPRLRRPPLAEMKGRPSRMARPKSPPEKIRSQMFWVRLREAEGAALKDLARALNQPASRVVRRLIREAITTGPDYFNDGLDAFRQVRRSLDRIGNNLNQLAAESNRGAPLEAAALKRVLNAVSVEVAAAAALYRGTMMDIESRAVRARETLEVLDQDREDGAG